VTISPWSEEYWWINHRERQGITVRPPTQAEQRDIESRFGVADPSKVAAQVNEICATRLTQE
jgi:hypothetical protein